VRAAEAAAGTTPTAARKSNETRAVRLIPAGNHLPRRRSREFTKS